MLPAIGFHHDNYLNAFNLADDLIEPWRPFVDLIALEDTGNSAVLSKKKKNDGNLPWFSTTNVLSMITRPLFNLE